MNNNFEKLKSEKPAEPEAQPSYESLLGEVSIDAEEVSTPTKKPAPVKKFGLKKKNLIPTEESNLPPMTPHDVAEEIIGLKRDLRINNN